MADEEAEAPPGAQEPVEALADDAVVGVGSSRRAGQEQIGQEHPRLQPVVDALAVHRVDQSGRIAHGGPSASVAAADAHGQPPGPGSLQEVAELPLPGHQIPVIAQQPVEVELSEALHSGHGARSDVHRAVARREHPAVAGNPSSLGSPQGEAGFQVPVGVAGAGRIGADGEAEGLGLDPLRAQQAGRRAGRSGGQHNHVGQEPLAPRGALDADDCAVVGEDRHDLGVPRDLGSRGLSCLDEMLVQRPAGPHRAVRTEPVVGGPQQLAPGGACDHAQPVDAVGPVELYAELVECSHCPRGEAVAAHLVTAGRGLLEDGHMRTATGGPDGRGRAGGPGPDHRDVAPGRAHGAARQHPPAP